MDNEKSDVELKDGANSCDASGAATEPANCRKCEKPQSGASFGAGGLSILFAVITLAIWVRMRTPDGLGNWAEVFQRLSVIFASLCVATGSVAISKKNALGIIGIFLIIFFAVAELYLRDVMRY